MHEKRKVPPGLARFMIRRLESYEEQFALSDALDEEYHEIYEGKGPVSAKIWYWYHAGELLISYLSHSIVWSLEMVRNYLKITMRNIRKQKGYSFINIAGLALGMACSFILLIYIFSEIDYDKFHTNAENIYRLGVHTTTKDSDFIWFSSNALTGEAAKTFFPEVINSVRFRRVGGRPSVKYMDKLFYQRGISYADASVFDVLTFPLLSGNPSTALVQPYSIVITEEMALKYFSGEDPLGKTLLLNDRHPYTVTGVMRNIPQNSDFRYNMLCSMESLYSIQGRNDELFTDWISYNFSTILLLKEGSDYRQVEEKLKALLQEKAGDRLNANGFTSKLLLQPFTDVHLHMSYGQRQDGIFFVYIFSAIAVFITLLACINYMNLSTARSVKRAREVGLRKVFGATREKLIYQFLSESILLSITAFIIAFILVRLFLPFVEQMAGRELPFNLANSGKYMLLFFGIAVLTGLLAGSYPALYLSTFRPSRIIIRGFGFRPAASRFRRILVVFQFTVSVILIIGTGLIMNQLSFMQKKDLGFRMDNIMMMTLQNNESIRSFPAIKERLNHLPAISAVGASSSIPGFGAQYNNFLPEGFSPDNMQLMDDIQADEDFLKALNFELIEGRNFSKEIASDVTGAVIINETAMKQFGWKTGVGKIIMQYKPQFRGMQPSAVIGVVKDFHLRRVTQRIVPVCISNNITHPYNPIRYISVKIKTGMEQEAIKDVKTIWKDMLPGLPFSFFFLEDSFNSQFSAMERSTRIFLSFTCIAVVIACLGLFGIASFTTEQRTKEIGIRKTLGSSAGRIVALLYKETALLVVIANCIAWPAAHYLIQGYLKAFPYRSEISYWYFTGSALLVILIAFATVAYQSLKAAMANPIKSLRTE